uniref:transcription initiation factor TFIID subunit 6-like isoform X2 n=1 Tax=Erigeron canadensis TaxID=72917 RepID=UPI001CB980C4|nr:transcription initiation factor TFIID subunit 6-like isoform X2 [Erigeron canadensis]
MSIVPKETVEVIAQSIGINNLSLDGALALAPDVEYRMREIMQEGIKCMHHSRRTTLTSDDIDSALSMRNVEPLYGFASGDPLRFKRALGHKDLFYIDDKDVDFKEVIEAPLPKAPLDTSLFCHWLAIEGVQPAIPENASIEVIAALPETKKPERKSDELPVDIRFPVKHVLSRELQLYLTKITELALNMPDSVLFKEALMSLATDSGLHPLVPYFTCFIEDEVSLGLNNFRLLFALMRLVWSLLQNPHLHIERYLHQLMPPVVSCIVAKRLGNRIADNHWELRDFTAKLVATICKRFGHNYSSLQTRLTKTFLNSFLDRKRSLTQHYGSVQGLAALGPHVVRLLLLPNLEAYLGFLEEIFKNTKKETTRYEAWRVYGALLRAAGRSIYDLLKFFPVLPSPPPSSVLKTNLKVISTQETRKRKVNAEELEQQPSPKRRITDGPLVSQSDNNIMTRDVRDKNAANVGESDDNTVTKDVQDKTSDNTTMIEDVEEKISNSMTEDVQDKPSNTTMTEDVQDKTSNTTMTEDVQDKTCDTTMTEDVQDKTSDTTMTEDVQDKTSDTTMTEDVQDKTSNATMAEDVQDKTSNNNSMAVDVQDKTSNHNTMTLDVEDKMSNHNPMTHDVEDKISNHNTMTQDVEDKISNHNTMTQDVQDKNAADVDSSKAETSSAREQMADDGVKDMNGRKGRGNRNNHGTRTPAYLKQVWKDDLNSGQLVISLFELFGEGIMSFIPAPEMSLFL